MFYRGQRSTLPSSRYGGALDCMEAMGWTYEQYCSQPALLIYELHVRLQKRALVEREQIEELGHV